MNFAKINSSEAIPSEVFPSIGRFSPKYLLKGIFKEIRRFFLK